MLPIKMDSKSTNFNVHAPHAAHLPTLLLLLLLLQVLSPDPKAPPRFSCLFETPNASPPPMPPFPSPPPGKDYSALHPRWIQ